MVIFNSERTHIHHMKNVIIYGVLTPVCYGVLVWLLFVHFIKLSPQEEWMAQAAPWLGEAPAGLRVYHLEPRSYDDVYSTVFLLPPNENVKQDFERAFPQTSERNPYGIWWTYEPLGASAESASGKLYLCPHLTETQEGWLRIVINRPTDSRTHATAHKAQTLYPEYMPAYPRLKYWGEYLLLFLGVFFPTIFCCVGWLWVQRKRIYSFDTCVICLVIPLCTYGLACLLILPRCGPYGGFDTLVGCVAISVGFSLLNIMLSLGMMAITALIRWLALIAKADVQKRSLT